MAYLEQMSGYHREELLDEDISDTQDVFPSNLTSIGNPHFFASGCQLVVNESPSHDHSQSSQNFEPSTNASNHENFSISFISNISFLERKRNLWSRMTYFERILFFFFFLLTTIIFTLSLILLLQPNPMLQVHLYNKDDASELILLFPNANIFFIYEILVLKHPLALAPNALQYLARS